MLRNNNYSFFKGYQDDDKKRASFNQLAVAVFQLSFELWYQSGYWKDKYIPYTLFDGDKAIANASANIMDFDVLGEKKRFIQIGTVMTDETYRNKGLSRYLLEKMIADWRDKCDFIYLFANSTVWDYYPKLGFKRFREYQYGKPVKSTLSTALENVDMDIQSNRDKLYDYANKSCALGKLSLQHNADLVMFYCITVYKNNVYYINQLDAFAIAIHNENKLQLLDVFSKTDVDLNEVIQSLAHNINYVTLGFTPNDCSLYEAKIIDESAKDEALFIMNDASDLFNKNKVVFPLLSHA